MKKRWIMALAVSLAIIAVLFAGCGKDAENKEESGIDSAEEIASPESGTQGTEGQNSLLQLRAADYVTLGDYKGLKVSVEEPEECSEDELELKTKQFYFQYVDAQEGITDRPVKLLDMTNIDYEGKKDGVAFDGGTAKGATLLIGSGQFIGGFEEGLIGVMPGETVDLNLTFPESYGSSELAGQAVVFTVTVNFIPEMEDSHVGEIGIEKVKTVDELRTYVKEAEAARAQSDYEAAIQNDAMNQIMQSAVFGEIPEEVITSARETYAGFLDQMAGSYGMDGKTYIEMYGMDYESTLDQYAQQYAKQLLVIMAIADNEGLNLSDEAFEARLEEAAKTSNITVDELLTNGLSKRDYRESFLYEDVMNYVVENTQNTAKQ